MVFCRGCGKEIHESAPTCPQCGAVQKVPASAALAADGPKWMGITSLVLGIICFLILFDEEPMDKDTIIGFLMFATVSIVFGAVSVKSYITAKKMAIAGIVLSSISVLALIGMHTQ
jgi:hypothetical protein